MNSLASIFSCVVMRCITSVLSSYRKAPSLRRLSMWCQNSHRWFRWHHRLTWQTIWHRRNYRPKSQNYWYEAFPIMYYFNFYEINIQIVTGNWIRAKLIITFSWNAVQVSHALYHSCVLGPWNIKQNCLKQAQYDV